MLIGVVTEVMGIGSFRGGRGPGGRGSGKGIIRVRYRQATLIGLLQ